MTYSHSPQWSASTTQQPVGLSPYSLLVDVPTSLLDFHQRAPINQRQSTASVPVVDGEVIASTVTFPARRWDDSDQILAEQPQQSLLRRAIDDPYWILMTLAITLGVSITATAIYGIIQITLAIGRWFTTNGTTLATIATLVIVLALCGTTAAKCTGLHCGGCNR